ncbi:hypothetical protein [Streptomyces sp. NPDC048659]|uniref:hypothetical protein n=1 Tax=Streptomyces sp. NPDC048659 TaxID=3155489 RepID=UPI0034323DF1
MIVNGGRDMVAGRDSRRVRGGARGRPVRLYEAVRLHDHRSGAERAARRFLLGARLAAAGAVLLGHLAVVLLWRDPGAAGQRLALGVGAAALACGVLWVAVLSRAARWVAAGVVADAGTAPPPPAGLLPDALSGPPDLVWDWARLLHLVSLGVPIGALVAALSAAADKEELTAFTAWGATGLALLVTVIMGGIIGGLGFGLVDGDEECWTPRGARRRLRRYAVPFLLSAPWLAGVWTVWAGALVCAAALWLLIAPVNYVGSQIPSVPSSD